MEKIFGDVMGKDYNVITFISKYLILRKPGVVIFSYIIRIVTMFIKTTTKDSRKVKKIRNYLSNSNLYVYFLMSQNLLISTEKMLMSAEFKGCVT